MKKIQLFLIVLVALLCIHCGNDKQATEENTAETVAGANKKPKLTPTERRTVLIINDNALTNKNLKVFIKNRYSDTTLIERNPRIASRVFDTFIEHQMILYKVNQAKVKLGPNELEDFLRDKGLQAENVNKKEISDSIKVQKYLSMVIYQNIEVGDTEIQEHYQSQRKSFKRTPEVLLHQIVTKDKEKAHEIRRELLKYPRKFAEIATRDSIAREKVKGGRMGYFEKGTLPKDMEDVVFALRTNSISPVVESPYGFHIFKVSKKKGHRTLAMKNVEENIRNKLLSDKLRQAYDQLLAKLKTQLNINIKYKALYFQYKPVNTGDSNNENQKNSTANNTNY